MISLLKQLALSVVDNTLVTYFVIFLSLHRTQRCKEYWHWREKKWKFTLSFTIFTIWLQHAKCNDRTVISLSTRINFPKTGALITFENSDFHWSLSRWKQLKHAMVVFHFLTRNTRDTSEIFVSAARRKNDSTPLCFFEEWNIY